MEYTFMTRSIDGTNKLYDPILDSPPPIRTYVATRGAVVGRVYQDS
jgi:hypothetical protein